MHGSVRSYRTPSGADRWEFTIELGIGPDGRRKQSRRRGFPTESAAVEAMQAELTDRRRGQFIEPDRTPLRDYLEQWLDVTAPSRSAHTTLHHRTCLNRAAPLGQIPLARLQGPQVQAWVNALSKRYAPRTVHVTYASLNLSLTQAVRWNLLPSNPASSISLPRIPTRREEPQKAWTAEQASRFLAVATGSPWEPLWRVLLDAQLRIGEAIALVWDDIDLEAGVIRVRRTLTRDAQQKRVIGTTTKTVAGIRDVTISAATVASLRRHRAAQRELRLSRANVWSEHGFVFPTGRGNRSSPNEVREALSAAAAAAGVPRLTPHGLRHTGASLLVLAGVPLVVVSRRLGHGSISVTADIYSHMTPDADRTAADTLARILNA